MNVTGYTITAWAVGGGTQLTFNCTTPTSCHLDGLSPETSYALTAVAHLSDGSDSPASAPVTLTMPAPATPTLVSAAALGPTTGEAHATPPTSGGSYTHYTFSAALLGNASNVVTCESATPSCIFAGLMPASEYEVTVVALDSGGRTTPASNALRMDTPAQR